MATAPTKLTIACPPLCSLHPDKIGEEKAEALKLLRESGVGQTVFMRSGSVILGAPIAGGTAQRHLKHYRLTESLNEAQRAPEPGKHASNLEILDRIIQRGYANSGSWKPSIKDTLDAMRLHLQMTGNSAFEDMLSAMSRGLDLADAEEDEGPPENPEALGDEEERLAPPALGDE